MKVYKPRAYSRRFTVLTQLMTSHIVLNQQFIFCTFLGITSELDEIELSIKRPTGLFFHALSDEAIKILVANVL